MKKLTTLLILTLCGCGCASSPPTLQENRTYLAEWIGEEVVIEPHQPSITFSEGRAYGNAGCNHWFASYHLEQNHLRFSTIGSTHKLCPAELMQQEQAFLTLLAQVERWDISKIDQLRLWPTQGKPLRFWPDQD